MNGIATRPLGRTTLRVSEIGVGTATLGNLYAPMADDAARATLDAALGTGLRYVDTAPHYGFGLSERRVGDAMRGRGDVVLSTKVGRLLVPDASLHGDGERLGFRSPMPFRGAFDYSHDGILRSHEASLQRLGLARIDILYVHDIGRLTHGDDHAAQWDALTRGGGLRALETLRSSGAIGAFGIGVNEVAVCLDVMAEVRLDAILLAGRYTLLEQTALDDLMPACAAAGTSIVVGGPYNSGILATGTKRGVPHFDYAPAPAAIVAKVAHIEAVAARHRVTLAAAALQFPLAHRQVASVIPGLASPGQVAETIALHREVIPASFWSELKGLSLVRADAPCPGDAA